MHIVAGESAASPLVPTVLPTKALSILESKGFARNQLNSKSISTIPIAYHPIYRLPLPENHRFPMEKYELLPQQLMLEGTCKKEDFFEPIPATLEQVTRVHDSNYGHSRR